jgi:hypothetical protein
VDPRVGLDNVEKRKFLTLPGLELRPLGRSTSRYTDYAIPLTLKQLPVDFMFKALISYRDLEKFLFFTTLEQPFKFRIEREPRICFHFSKYCQSLK